MSCVAQLLFVLAATVLGSSSAAGARFPDAVERTFTLHGDAARTAAAWFGLDPAREGAVSLRLGRGDAWAVYLLKLDTPERLWNDNDGSPPRIDTISYRPTPSPELTLGTFWLDLGTGLPNARPGSYSFASGFLPATLAGDDPWLVVARHLRPEPASHPTSDPQMRPCVADDHGVELCLALQPMHDYAADRDGHAVVVTIRDQSRKR